MFLVFYLPNLLDDPREISYYLKFEFVDLYRDQLG